MGQRDSEYMGKCFYEAGGNQHHFWPTCSVGRVMPKDIRLEGTGGLPPCEKCVTLANEESERQNPGTGFYGRG